VGVRVKCESERMQECETARLRECENARVRECESARVRECESARVRECESVRECVTAETAGRQPAVPVGFVHGGSLIDGEAVQGAARADASGEAVACCMPHALRGG
jgi:hypothetical protein